MRTWHGIPYPAFLPGLTSLLVLLKGLMILRGAVALGASADMEDLRIDPTFLWIWAAVWLLSAIGMWCERDWARTLLRVIATLSVAYALFITFSMIIPTHGSMPFSILIPEFSICALAWISRFWAEVSHESKAVGLHVGYRSWLGRIRLIWHQVRRVLGYGYYRWSSDPYLIGMGGSLTPEQRRRSLAIPPVEVPLLWARAGTIHVSVGELLVCDPELLSGWEDAGVRIEQVPVQAHVLDLHVVRLRRHGLCVLRARLLWQESDEAFLNHLGDVLVDHASLCIGDFQTIVHGSGSDFTSQSRLRARGKSIIPAPPLIPDEPEVGRRFPSGLGDGSYPVWSIDLQGGRRIGILIDMSEITSKLYEFRRRGWRSKPPSPDDVRAKPSKVC